MPNLKVNGKDVTFDAGMTILQACEIAGEEIPRFCYHERLKIAGNCRMCLVQVEGGPPKPVASCAMPAAEGMVVHTNTPMVKKAREGVMEFLLINHPLDCPICDQGGECDLQDQAMAYGRGVNRYNENKRAVPEKYLGPLITTFMNRCIHCTRCVRFIDDVAGVSELGAVNRGEKMEITTYIDKSLTSELSGNIVDLCPVGALTSRPYKYRGRPWELRKTESVDVLDAVGSNIRIDSRGKEVMRILPRVNEDINEEWISDKTRYAYDGLKLQRLDRPYIRKEGKLVEASWDEALKLVAERLTKTKPENIAALAGDLVDCESVYALGELLDQLQVFHRDCRQDGAKLDPSKRVSYLFNTTIAGIERADVCLLIGTNPRIEAPILNARIRKAQLQNGLKVGLIGARAELTYQYQDLGDSPEVLQQVLEGDHEFASLLKEAKNPMLILGMSALKRHDGHSILAAARQIAENCQMVREDFNGFNILHRAAGRVGALDLGFVPKDKGKNTKEIIHACTKGEIEVLYLLGADEIPVEQLGKVFVIYQGHHGDAGAHRADVIFPGAAYTEKNATYVNTEGRAQHAYLATYPLGEAKEDWNIIAQLSHYMSIEPAYKNIEDIRKLMAGVSPVFSQIGQVTKAPWADFGHKGVLASEPFIQDIESFYRTDVISRISRVMAQCTQDILGQGKNDQEAA